jgi:hypothetical protein
VLILATAVRAKFGDNEGVPNLLVETTQVDRAEWHKLLDKRVSQLETKDTSNFKAIEERLRALEANAEQPLSATNAGVVSSPKAPNSTPASDLLRFSAGLKAVMKAKAEILAWYDGNSAVLEKAPVRPPDEDKILVAKMVKAMHGGLTDDEEQAFIISVVGSSMSAGHDNFRNGTFAAILQRTLQPAWDSLGVKFKVRNLAVGGRNPSPWPLCMKQLVGDDTDLLIYELSFWNFEAGYASTLPIQKKGADVEQAGLEILLRNVYRLPKQPVIHFLQMDTTTRHDVMSWMDQWFEPGMPLSAYSSFPMNGFDAFGEPFNHLISRAEKKGTRALKPPVLTNLWKGDEQKNSFTREPEKCPSGDKTDVNKCLIDPLKPDGYHTLPKHLLGDNIANHVWMNWYFANGMGRLFGTWHPAPLAHELIANQLAYYQLAVMEEALKSLIGAPTILRSSAFGKNVQKGAAARHLPTNVLCNDVVCNPNFAQKCAFSSLPKISGPDIGDWMVNDTAGSNWINERADKSLRCKSYNPYLDDSWWDLDERPGHNDIGEGGRGFNLGRVCTLEDQNRGMKGYPDNAPLSLTFTDMASCKIWLGESTYGSSGKPGLLANWESELAFKVNGEPCGEHCKVHSQGGRLAFQMVVYA